MTMVATPLTAGKVANKSVRCVLYTKINVAFQKRIITDESEVIRRSWMPYQKIIFGDHEQDCKRRFVPILPHSIAHSLTKPKGFC
ncbi:MAG: hypothetical protein C4334_03145 [Pyrinomonas sp.]